MIFLKGVHIRLLLKNKKGMSINLGLSTCLRTPQVLVAGLPGGDWNEAAIKFQ